MSEEQYNHIADLAIKEFLEGKLNAARGNMISMHIDAAVTSKSIFKSTVLIQRYYKYSHRIEVLTELLEEFN